MAKLRAGENDLQTLHPELAAQWHPSRNGELKPSDVTAGAKKRVWWLCDLGHEYEAVVYSRKVSGCPVCSGRKVLPGFNDLATSRPDLLIEWDFGKNAIHPNQVTSGSGKKVFWICKSDTRHSWEARISLRVSGRNCPICSNHAIVPGVNDLGTTHPYIASQWDKSRNALLPSHVSAGSNIKLWWKCPKNHSYLATPAARTGKRKAGCAVCENRQVEQGTNDLATTHPHLVKEIDFELSTEVSPTNITAGFGGHVNWKCSEGHRWRATVINRTRTGKRKNGVPIVGTGCPICNKEVAGRRATQDYNLATTHPHLVVEWDRQKNKRSIQSYTQGVQERVHWLCKSGHKWTASIINRTYNNQGCPVCANQRTDPGENDLQTLFPELAVEWHPSKNDVLPSSIQPGSPRNYWWLCEAGHAFRASPVNRTRGGTNCPSCAESGYDPTEKGYLYLLSKPEFALQQFGITNFPDKRLRTHRSNGWLVLDLYGPTDGYWITDMESLIKKYFRFRRVLLPRSYPDKFDGFSESWNSAQIQYKSLKKLIRDVEIWESQEMEERLP